MSRKSSPYSQLPPVRRPSPAPIRAPVCPPPKISINSSSNAKRNSISKNLFDQPSLLIRKKTNSFILQTSHATLSTIQDSNSTLPSLNKTSLAHVRGSDPRAKAFRSKGRSNTTNILDTSSGATLNSYYTNSHSSAKLTRGSSLEPFSDQPSMSRNFETINESVLTTTADILPSVKRAQAPRKGIQLAPLNLKGVVGKYEKPPQSVERDLKNYVQKVHAIDQLDSRRLKKRGQSEGLNEGALACRKSLSKIPGLRPEEKERFFNVSIDDENYFKKIESAIMDTTKRIDRDQRLTQTIELVNGEWIKMDTEKMEWRYCFISVKGMPAPMEVSIKTPKGVKNLKVYISRSQKKPSKGYHDLDFENKKMFKIYEKDRSLQTFTTACLYFALCLEVSGFISVKIHFAEPENNNQRNRLLPFPLLRNSPWKQKFWTEGNEDSDFKKDIMDDYVPIKHKKDLIGLNRSNLDKYSIESRRQTLEGKKTKLESMIKKTLENKQEIVLQKQKQSYIKLISKDVQKGLKEMIQEEHEKRVKAEIMGKHWFTCMTMMNMAKHIFECLQKGRERERIRLQRVMAATLIAIKYRSSQRSKGPDVKYRLTLDIRSALSLTANVIQESELYKNGKIEEEENAEALMINFLQESRQAHYLRNRINMVIQRITNIQTVWKKFLKKKQGFLEILRRLWIRNSVRIFEDVILPKMKKDYEKKEKLTQIKNFDIKNNEKAQDRFVSSYYRKVKENYERRYEIYHKLLKEVDRKEKVTLSFLDILKRGVHTLDEEPDESDQPKLVTQKTTNILEEIENNQIEDEDDDEPTAVKPPRLFILPNMRDIEGLLAECIETQIVESLFPRKNERLLKALSSFNAKIAKK